MGSDSVLTIKQKRIWPLCLFKRCKTS